jgi:hypothetical protein
VPEPAALAFTTESDRGTRFLEAHGAAAAAVLGGCDPSPREALAVVFPEVLRYTRFRDRLETSLLQGFFVAGGFGDFSVGPFQMKPSFALALDAAAGIPPPAREERRAWMDRLTSLDAQLDLLCRFMAVMRRRHPAWWRDLGATDRLVRLATAYNSGFEADDETVVRRADRRGFPGAVLRDLDLRYADVALAAYATTLARWPEAAPGSARAKDTNDDTCRR